MNETLKMKLLKKLPKKYHDRVVDIEKAYGLVDNCKYILYFSKEYTDGDGFSFGYPVRSISEAIDFIKNSLYKVEN